MIYHFQRTPTDGWARLEAISDLNGQSVRLRYNSQSHLTRITDSTNRILALEIDANGHILFQAEYADNLITITSPDGIIHTCYTDGSLVIERWLPGGADESFSYDEEGRLTRHELKIGDSTSDSVLDREYDYNILGHLILTQDNGNSQSFQYDNTGRLTAVISEIHRETFGYDPGGNPQPLGGGLIAEYQAGNQLVAWGDRRYTYDYRGRLETETRGEEQYTYSYDTAGQLACVSLPNGRTAEYQYDPLRRRVSKKIGEEETLFGWDGDRLSWEVLPNETKRYYFYLNDGDHSPVMFCDVGQESGGGEEPKNYFIHYDPSHRPILITNIEGKTVWSAKYTVYGLATVSPESAITYNRRAPGQYLDNETGFHYNYHRYYDPVTGRYTQPDLIGLAGGLNLYSYGEGNPLGVCDVLGLANK